MPSLLPPVPTTAEMDALHESTAWPSEPYFDTTLGIETRRDVGMIGDLYRPDDCPWHLVETMYRQFGAEALWWNGNPQDVKRRIYANFFLPPTEDDPAVGLDGILPNRGGLRALQLFSDAIGVVYTYLWELSGSRRVTFNLNITPLTPEQDALINTAEGRAYLTRAYRYLVPIKFGVRITFVTAQRHTAQVFVAATARFVKTIR